jgi:5-methylcytosine-specific restriction endonuclease McrA
VKGDATFLTPVDDNAVYRRRCGSMRRDHVRRARPLFQTVDFTLAELIAFVQANRTCAYCGCVLTASTFSLDHAFPISRKADFRLANLRVCCEICQERKGALNSEEYRELLRLISTWAPVAGTDVLRRLRAGGAQLAYTEVTRVLPATSRKSRAACSMACGAIEACGRSPYGSSHHEERTGKTVVASVYKRRLRSKLDFGPSVPE